MTNLRYYRKEKHRDEKGWNKEKTREMYKLNWIHEMKKVEIKKKTREMYKLNWIQHTVMGACNCQL